MSSLVLKFGVICWSFVALFVAFLSLAMLIPNGAILYVSATLGFLILALVGYNLWQIHLREGFDFGWFLTVKKGYWRILPGLFGLILFSIGLFGLIFPEIGNQLGERYAMKVAYLLAILFWMALTSTFLSWSLVCFSEATVYWRLAKAKTAVGSFGLGILWLLLATLFLSLFLDMINENFFNLSAKTQNWILGVFAFLSLVTGVLSGRYEDLKRFAEEESSN